MDIRVLILVLVIIIVFMLGDITIRESSKVTSNEPTSNIESKEHFDVNGIDSSEIAKISKLYESDGSFTFANVTATYFNLLPKGSIVMFNGSAVPVGWTLCNGQNGTPNLMGRIPMGDRTSGGLAGPALNATGSTSTDGNHSHTVNKGTRSYLNDVTGCCKKRRTVISNAWSGAAGNHSHTVTVNNVSSIYPDCTNVMFIMKL